MAAVSLQKAKSGVYDRVLGLDQHSGSPSPEEPWRGLNCRRNGSMLHARKGAVQLPEARLAIARAADWFLGDSVRVQRTEVTLDSRVLPGAILVP